MDRNTNGQLDLHLCFPVGQSCPRTKGPWRPKEPTTLWMKGWSCTSVRGCGFGRYRLVCRRGCEMEQVVQMLWHYVCKWKVDEDPEKEERSFRLPLARKELSRSQSIPKGINSIKQESMRPQEFKDRLFLVTCYVAKSVWTCFEHWRAGCLN